jgi:hypothetical protein
LKSEILHLFPVLLLDDQLLLVTEDLVLPLSQFILAGNRPVLQILVSLCCFTVGQMQSAELLLIFGLLFFVVEAPLRQLSDLNLVIFIIKNLAFGVEEAYPK